MLTRNHFVASIGLAQEKKQDSAALQPATTRGATQEPQEPEEKFTIKDIMKEAHDSKTVARTLIALNSPSTGVKLNR